MKEFAEKKGGLCITSKCRTLARKHVIEDKKYIPVRKLRNIIDFAKNIAQERGFQQNMLIRLFQCFGDVAKVMNGLQPFIE